MSNKKIKQIQQKKDNRKCLIHNKTNSIKKDNRKCLIKNKTNSTKKTIVNVNLNLQKGHKEGR